MRALLVCAAPSSGTPALLARIAAAHDLVIGVDGGAAACLEAAVPIDLLVGDFDSLDPGLLASLEEAGVPARRFPAEKDETDLDLALMVAAEAGATRVTVTGAVGLRLDHTLAALGSLERAAHLAPMVVEPDFHAWVLDALQEPAVVLEGRGATVSLLPLSEAIVSCSGVRWPLDEARLRPLSSLGVSNVITADEASIKVTSGSVLVCSPRISNVESATSCDLRHIMG